MKPSKQAQASRARRDHADDFYEMMPLTASSHYVYRDDADDYDPGEQTAADPQAATRRVAIVTLLVLAVTAAVVGFALAEGLAALQVAMGTPL